MAVIILSDCFLNGKLFTCIRICSEKGTLKSVVIMGFIIVSPYVSFHIVK